MIRNQHLFHGVLLFVVIFSLTILVLYQVIVNRNQQRLAWTEFLKPAMLTKSWQSLFVHHQPVNLEDVYWFEESQLYRNLDKPERIQAQISPSEAKELYVSTSQDKLAFINEAHELIVIKSRDREEIKLDQDKDQQIIHWLHDSDALIVAEKGDTWSLLILEGKEITHLVDEIVFPQKSLTQSYAPIHDIIVYPSCDPVCEFVYYSLSAKEIIHTQKALVEHDPDKDLEQMRVHFFDETRSDNFVAYSDLSSPDHPQFYVMSDKRELIQNVSLYLHDTIKTEFLGYDVSNGRILYSSHNEDTQSTLFFSYKINEPSLKLIDTANLQPKTMFVTHNGIMAIGDNLKHSTNPDFSFDSSDLNLVSSR